MRCAVTSRVVTDVACDCVLGCHGWSVAKEDATVGADRTTSPFDTTARYPLLVSLPERACLELLADVPHRFDIGMANAIGDGLRTRRPAIQRQRLGMGDPLQPGRPRGVRCRCPAQERPTPLRPTPLMRNSQHSRKQIAQLREEPNPGCAVMLGYAAWLRETREG